MTTTPFVCAKSDEEFLPDEGGTCGVCQRLLLGQYLHSHLFARQLTPICVDCLKDLADLAMERGRPGLKA